MADIKIFKIETPLIKLDGGALFGVIPKWMWKNKYPSDENNLCTCATRSLLIDEGDRIVLIDAGVGTKHDKDELIYDFDGADNDLEINLQKNGYKPEDITDVILTHLHYDHCGGALKYNENKTKLLFSFPNANYHISKLQWKNALSPNYRERASYKPENIELLIGSKKLNLIENNKRLTKNIEIKIFNGHTQGLLVPIINYKNREIAFAGDLIPILALIPLAWISAFDVRPLEVIEEKEDFLNESYEKNRIIVFQHDYYNECCDLKKTPKGIRANNVFKLETIIKNDN